MTRDSGVQVSDRRVPARSSPGTGTVMIEVSGAAIITTTGTTPASTRPSASPQVGRRRDGGHRGEQPERDDEVRRADEPNRRNDEQRTEPRRDEVDCVRRG